MKKEKWEKKEMKFVLETITTIDFVLVIMVLVGAVQMIKQDDLRQYDYVFRKYLNKYDRSVDATVDGYYFHLLTSAKGEKYLDGITISVSIFDIDNLTIHKFNIPINQLAKRNFKIRITDADEVASSINDPNKAYTGSGARHMIFINMYQNLKNKLQEEIGTIL